MMHAYKHIDLYLKRYFERFHTLLRDTATPVTTKTTYLLDLQHFLWSQYCANTLLLHIFKIKLFLYIFISKEDVSAILKNPFKTNYQLVH